MNVKKRRDAYGMSIICMFTLLLSGQMAFAGKGKNIKSVSKALTSKTTVADVASVKSSSPARRGEVSGAAVERAVVMAATKGATVSTSYTFPKRKLRTCWNA